MSAPARIPGGAPASPAAVAQALLTGVLDWWAEHEDPAGDDPAAPRPLPARRYVAGGDPRTVAWDYQEGQVTVALGSVVLGLDSLRPAAPARVPRSSPANHAHLARTAAYEVQVVRCAPGASTADELNAHGLLVTADAGHLMSAVIATATAGRLSRAPVGEHGVVIGDLVTLGPEGGSAACALTVTVPLL